METIDQSRKRDKEIKKSPFYGIEYRESLARRKGFKSYLEYTKYLEEKRKEKLRQIEKKVEGLRMAERLGEEEIERLGEEKIKRLEEEKQKSKKILESKDKQELCRSLQDIVTEVKDPESIFKDIEFVREYTGCKIPLKKIKVSEDR